MANENMIKFLRGSVANLPQTATAGTLYFTEDEGLYLGLEDGTYHRYGDFIIVANVDALPETGAHDTCMYYCVAENILAKYDTTEGWIQINKQPTAEEMKTLLGLGTAAYTDANAYDAAGAAQEVRAYVGDIPETATATNIVAYIQEKTAGIATDTALEELTGRVATAEGEIDALQADIVKKVESVGAGDNSITIGGTATNPTVAVKLSAAEGNALELAADGLKVIIPESTKVEASTQNGYIKVDGEEVKVFEVPANTYDAYGAADQALVDAKAYVDEEDKFETDILTVDKFGGIAAGSDLNGMTTHEILNALLYPYIAFVINSSSRNAAAATLENGATQTLNSASISITKKSKPITSVKLLNGSTVLGEKTGNDVAAGGTITFSNLGITVTKDNNPNLKFTVTDGTTSTDKNVGASTFVYPYYMGECAANATIDETLIEGLTKKVESKGNKTVTHSCENGRMVIAYPKAHGVLKSILDPNNFETIGDYTRSEVSITGLDGSTQTYYVYASGAATVSGFKVQYKY